MPETQIIPFELAIETVNNQIAEVLEPEVISFESVDDADCFLDADMDGWDYVACLSAGLLSMQLATNKRLEEWLAGVHDVANGQHSADDPAQAVLARLFKHSGDDIDWFKKRESDQNPYAVFHRLFWGHDVFAWGDGKDKVNDNPLYLMIMQDKERGGIGVLGLLRGVRHLIADTMSTQGLPIPGHSYLDYTREDGKVWNYLLDLVQELSIESTGNKATETVEALYSHLFSIRMQDITGGLAAKALIDAYLKARRLDDDIRQAQIRLLAYAFGFYAEAVVGAAKQKGVPYINIPLGSAMAKESASLLLASNKRTFRLEKESGLLLEKSKKALDRHERLKGVIADDAGLLLSEGGDSEQ